MTYGSFVYMHFVSEPSELKPYTLCKRIGQNGISKKKKKFGIYTMRGLNGL